MNNTNNIEFYNNKEDENTKQAQELYKTVI